MDQGAQACWGLLVTSDLWMYTCCLFTDDLLPFRGSDPDDNQLSVAFNVNLRATGCVVTSPTQYFLMLRWFSISDHDAAVYYPSYSFSLYIFYSVLSHKALPYLIFSYCIVCYYCYLEAMEVRRLEVVGGAPTPVHDVLVLALTPQLPVPVGDAQVVIHHALAVGAVLQHRVEERLEIDKHKWREAREEEGAEDKFREQCTFYFYTIQFTREIVQQQRAEIHSRFF